MLKKRYLEKERGQQIMEIAPPFPKIVKIDICDTCNYSCIFCPQAYQKGRRGCIDDSVCLRVIEESRKGGAEELALSSTGEPLLNRNLEKYAAFAKEIGYKYIFFNTNGYLLDRERSRKIIESGVDSVKISINAGRESYYLIHGADAYERVLNNIKAFDEERKRAKSLCKLYVSFISTKITEAEIEDVRKDTEPYVDEFIFMKANNRGGLVSNFDSELYEGNDEFSYSYPCSQLFNNVYITADGYLDACCQDFDQKMIIADLNTTSVIDAWNCEAFREFRKRYIEKNLNGTLCVNCLGWDTCAEICPLNSEYSGYETDALRQKSLEERIKKLTTKGQK